MYPGSICENQTMASPMKRSASELGHSPSKKAKKDDFGYPHEQVEVSAPFGTIKVDKGIVDTLQMIWKEGYHTYLSCENNHGKVWISFDNKDYERLVTHAVSTEDRDDLTSVKLGEEVESLHSFLETKCESSLRWMCDGEPDDSGVYWHTNGEVIFMISLRFDVELLDTFKKLFKRSHKDSCLESNQIN